jgi:hypothetical protein
MVYLCGLEVRNDDLAGTSGAVPRIVRRGGGSSLRQDRSETMKKYKRTRIK